jgi:hypothetical protein
MTIALRIAKVEDDITYDFTRRIQTKSTRIANVELKHSLTIGFKLIGMIQYWATNLIIYIMKFRRLLNDKR